MLRIAPATGRGLQSALELLFGSLSAEARSKRIVEIREEIARGEFDPRDLLLAEIDSYPVGVQLTIISDAVGLVWPPIVDIDLVTRLNGLPCEAIEDALLCEARQRLDAAGAWIGQVLLEVHQLSEGAAMERNGFPRLTDLSFFEHSLANVDSLRREEGLGLTYEPYRRSHNRLAFINTLEATYCETLDCPELNGVRDARQSLKYHETAGAFASDMWRLYRHEGVNVGVQLLVTRPDQQAWEVLYLGVVKQRRRHGVGRAMLIDALQAAGNAKVKRLLIVADARNLPAIKLYQSLGFKAVATRVAYARLNEVTK